MKDYETIEQIKLMIQDLLNQAGFKAVVTYEDSLLKGLVFNIDSRESRSIIGRQGNTLEALDTLVWVMVKRKFPDFSTHFTVDVDDYKRQREYLLKQKLEESVAELKKTNKPVKLPEMSRHERRYLHRFIQDNYPEVESNSEGQEPHRFMVISSIF